MKTKSGRHLGWRQRLNLVWCAVYESTGSVKDGGVRFLMAPFSYLLATNQYIATQCSHGLSSLDFAALDVGMAIGDEGDLVAACPDVFHQFLNLKQSQRHNTSNAANPDGLDDIWCEQVPRS